MAEREEQRAGDVMKKEDVELIIRRVMNEEKEFAVTATLVNIFLLLWYTIAKLSQK